MIMIGKRTGLTLLLFSFFLLTHAQVSSIQMPERKNQTDENGRKQGPWEKYYPNGNLIFSGVFLDDHPVGKFMRYFESGGIKAIMNFDSTGNYAQTTLFYEDGTKAAEGLYFQNKKDSTWKYYSYYTQELTLLENYNKGLKNGISIQYYPNGNIVEEIEWENNRKDGKWNQYFENGTQKLKASFTNDLRNGRFTFYYPSGQEEIVGEYLNGNKEGEWKYFDEEGEETLTINYRNGFPQDKEKLEEREKEFFEKMEENMGKIEEPDLDDFVP